MRPTLLKSTPSRAAVLGLSAAYDRLRVSVHTRVTRTVGLRDCRGGDDFPL